MPAFRFFSDGLQTRGPGGNHKSQFMIFGFHSFLCTRSVPCKIAETAILRGSRCTREAALNPRAPRSLALWCELRSSHLSGMSGRGDASKYSPVALLPPMLTCPHVHVATQVRLTRQGLRPSSNVNGRQAWRCQVMPRRRSADPCSWRGVSQMQICWTR